MFKKNKDIKYVIKVNDKYVSGIKPVPNADPTIFQNAVVLYEFRQYAQLYDYLPDAEEKLMVVEGGKIFKINRNNWEEEYIPSKRFELKPELIFVPESEEINDEIKEVVKKAKKQK